MSKINPVTSNDDGWSAFLIRTDDALNAELAGVNAELEAPGLYQYAGETLGDGADQAVADEERCRRFQRQEWLKTRKAELIAARSRITNGTYGICLDPSCGQRIEKERMLAYPLALYHAKHIPTGRKNGASNHGKVRGRPR